MSSTSELSSFAARLRGFMASTKAPPGGAAADVRAFGQLALELFALQFEHNAPYRRFCEARGARPGAVNHWTGIPAIPTSAFKEWELSCLAAAERTNVFHSSGTTAQRPSRHFHSAESLALYETSLLTWFNAHAAMAHGRWHMAILTPPPAQAPHSSLVHMFETIRRRWSPGDEPFVGKVAEEGGWALELEAAVQLLSRAKASGQPLLLLGTAFSFVHLLDHLAGQGMRLQLPPGSCALETGGYKGRSRSLPKTALHALISQRLGIPASHIICEYGMSELSSQAYDSPGGVLHFPPWARVQIISPESGRGVGEGESGLIRLFDLANVYSVMAIQTEDLGTRRGDGFTLAGRAALAEPRGCSLMPTE
jgi:Acyl-protein synthetase, LuxE